MTPGDAWMDPLIKRGEELERIPAGERTSDDQRELDVIKEAARFRSRLPTVADNPKTLLVDESKRPQLDGTDWNDFNNAMCRAEVASMGMKYGLPLINLVVDSLLQKR